jgi:allantoate deiminase
VEKCGVTATVGQIAAEPGASNVIPGRAILTLDVRDLRDVRRRAAVRKLHVTAKRIAKARRVKLKWHPVQETPAVSCDPALTRLMRMVVARHERQAIAVPSGAGHDAAAISAICPVTMLFVRCRRGISHHPDEAVKTADVARAITVLSDFIESLGAKHA